MRSILPTTPLASIRVTTNPRHVQASGKPFKVALRDISAWLKDHGLAGYAEYPRCAITKSIPHLSAAANMMQEKASTPR